MNPHHRIRITVAAIATFTAIAGMATQAVAAPAPTPSTPVQSTVQNTRLATQLAQQNQTLLPDLYSRGGTLTADRKFIHMPDGTEVSLAPAALSDCPGGWVCLWSDASYTGRLLRWNAPGARVNLSDIGFDHQMTSWANRGPYDARWFYNANSSGTTRCMNAGTNSANVGTTDNDKASSLAIYTDSAAC